MNKLSKTIKKFNLVFTDTVDDKLVCRDDFDLAEYQVNYDNCVSLNEVKEAFRVAHQAFKEEYDKLDKFDLGEKVTIDYHSMYEDNDGEFRILVFYIENPTFTDKKETLLYFKETDKSIETWITDTGYYDEDKDYKIDIKLDEDKVRGYLDLFDKYDSLYDFYNRYDSSSLHDKKPFCLLEKISSPNENFLDDMDSMSFYLSTTSFTKPGDRAEITVNLKENKIDLENSSLEIRYKDFNITEGLYEKILEEVYVNRDALNHSMFPEKEDKRQFDRLCELKDSLEKSESVLIKK